MVVLRQSRPQRGQPQVRNEPQSHKGTKKCEGDLKSRIAFLRDLVTLWLVQAK